MDKSNDTIQVISKCLNNIFVSIAPVKGKAYLFGSRARGDARNDSDWDVLILLDKNRITSEDFDKVSYPVRELGWQIDSMINPVIYTMSEWEGKSFTPFYKNVMNEGVAL